MMPKGKNGLALKVTGDVINRLLNVRALWFAVYNDPRHSVQDTAVEFFYAVGKLLEGVPVDQLECKKIDLHRVLQHVKEG
jgi:hypothetical protein